MKKTAIFLCMIIISLSIAQAQSGYEFGVNLVQSGAFVNVINENNRFEDAEGFDPRGWPTSDFGILFDWRPVAEWEGEIDDPEEYRVDYSGTYKAKFTGAADVSAIWGEAYVENYSYDSQINESRFNLVVTGPPASGRDFFKLVFANTQRSPEGSTNAGITDLRIVRPGYALETEKIFTDEYVELCKEADFKCYRFYDLQNIWQGEPEFPAKTTWERRRTPDDASQQPTYYFGGKRDGWCWEYIIELANILNKDIWVNFLISCDENYVREAATMLNENLNPNINIYVENSNEVWAPDWNTHGPYNQAQAEFYEISFDENYARRTVELSNIFAEVFGEDQINDRIRVILAGQASWHERSDVHLNYINDTFGPPKDYVYATSEALYFGTTKQGGLPHEVIMGMFEDIDAQINDDSRHNYRRNHLDKAEDWGLPGGCTSYEGGPHVPAGGGQHNLDNLIIAHRTPEMENVIKYNYEQGWFDIGGGLALYFTLWSGYNRYGCWGITDDYTNPDRNHKMKAIRYLAGGESSVESEINGGSLSSARVFPNPAENSATLAFDLARPQSIKVELFDRLGRKVATISEGFAEAGEYRIPIDVSTIPAGVYAACVSGETVEVVRFVAR